MPPHETYPPGSPQEWLQYAQSDLAIAGLKDIPDDILFEELCFHAQQAVEKSLKSLLVFKKISFPKTHNIRVLLDLLPVDVAIPEEIADSARLTDYAVMSRYPGVMEAVEKKEQGEAFLLAEAVVAWVKKQVR